MVKKAVRQRDKYSPPPQETDECQCTRATAAKPSIGQLTHLYPYKSADGTRLFSRFRYLVTSEDSTEGDKTFRYCPHYDRTNPEHVAMLYGLPRVKEAVLQRISPLYLVEGENDCEPAWALEDAYTTTTHLGTRFPIEAAEHFRGYAGIVYIVVDRDHLDSEHKERFAKGFDYPGAAAALRKWRALKEVGVKAFFREAIVGKDMRDHLENGKSITALRKVTLEQIKERAPKESASKSSVTMKLSAGDLPEGPGMRRFIAALEAKGFYLEKIGPTRYKTNCPHPEHDDRNPSFEFEQGIKPKVVGTCESGQCTWGPRDDKNKGWKDICSFLGIPFASLQDNWNPNGKKPGPKTRMIGVSDDQARTDETFPAFHAAFEGHIGSTFDQEPNDKGNGRRMAALYGKVFRRVHMDGGEQWRVWSGTHWAPDTGAIVHAASADLTDYMEFVEGPRLAAEVVPPFPSDWDVINQSGKPYKALLGRYGAMTQAPTQTVAYASKGPDQAAFLGERLKAEQEDSRHQEMLKWIERCKDGARMREAVKQLEHQPGISVTDADFNNARGTFCVLNGQINTKTLELEPHCLEDMNTRIVPVAYRPSATAPIWEAYLAMNQPNEETRRYLQKLIGYAISGDGNQKLIVFMYSHLGDTGKSLFLNVIERVLGNTYTATLAEGSLSKRRFDNGGRDPDRDAIRGKRFVLSSELAPNEPLDERFVKQLTGGDGVSTRGNFSRDGNTRWQPECLVAVATNHLSRINAEDEAIWNRIQVVPWSVSFPRTLEDGRPNPARDDMLLQKIVGAEGFPGEVEGVLAWIVEGLRLYREEGLIPPSEVVNASMGYRSDADVVQMWLSAAVEDGDIVIDEEAYTLQRRDLYKHIQQWAKDDRARDIPGLRMFYSRLEDLGFRMGTRKIGNDDASKRKVLIGIAITGEASIGLSFQKG